MTHQQARYDPAKRCLDAAVASVLLVATAPIQVAIAVAIAIRLGRPVLFRQDRVGRGDRIFELIKFRTMRDVDPARGLMDDVDRLTPFGRALRAMSVDELPSLINVLRGDMSMVGPRPLLVRYLPRYSAQQARRHEVRPGMTGLAQVNGRNAASWEQRFEDDVFYVDNRSPALDARIVVRTFLVVLGRKGVSADGHVTSPEFFGTAETTS